MSTFCFRPVSYGPIFKRGALRTPFGLSARREGMEKGKEDKKRRKKMRRLAACRCS